MAPGRIGGMVIQYRYEPIEYLLKTGLPELVLECWDNIGDDFHSDVFSPDWGRYKEQEEEKSLGVFAMREEGVLVGYAVLKINRDIHQSHLRVGLIHDIYITEKKRGYAIQFVHELEKYAKMMGVWRIDGAERLSFDAHRGGAGKFYHYMGFRPMEVIWSKVLGEEGNA